MPSSLLRSDRCVWISSVCPPFTKRCLSQDKLDWWELFVTLTLCASRKSHTYSRVGGIETTHYCPSSRELTYNFTRNSHKRHINLQGLVIVEEVEWATSAIVLTRSDDCLSPPSYPTAFAYKLPEGQQFWKTTGKRTFPSTISGDIYSYKLYSCV